MHVLAIHTILLPKLEDQRLAKAHRSECSYVISASQMSELAGDHFGQRRPPLSVTIKAILERYPDGQIFKVHNNNCVAPEQYYITLYGLLQEIIQNADDAGARTVKFFIDSREHQTRSLVNRALAPFQGLALLAYNDARFTDKDWKGIQDLQCSVKAEDPFKVGKFGIGFNSVYHITGSHTNPMFLLKGRVNATI